MAEIYNLTNRDDHDGFYYIHLLRIECHPVGNTCAVSMLCKSHDIVNIGFSRISNDHDLVTGDSSSSTCTEAPRLLSSVESEMSRQNSMLIDETPIYIDKVK